MKNIYLIGMMGAGKTSIGKIAAKKAHCRFIDTDAFIEEQAGMTVAEIFEREGEGSFRQRETEALRSLGKKRNCVISTGGGIVTRKENIALMRESGTVIWLKRDLNAVLQNPGFGGGPFWQRTPTLFTSLWKSGSPFIKRPATLWCITTRTAWAR